MRSVPELLQNLIDIAGEEMEWWCRTCRVVYPPPGKGIYHTCKQCGGVLEPTSSNIRSLETYRLDNKELRIAIEYLLNIIDSQPYMLNPIQDKEVRVCRRLIE